MLHRMRVITALPMQMYKPGKEQDIVAGERNLQLRNVLALRVQEEGQRYKILFNWRLS